MRSYTRGRQLLGVLCTLVVFAFFSKIQAQKLKPEEIIAKHIASIGTPENVANSKLRMAVGTSNLLIRDPPREASGTTVLASDGNDMAFISTFNLRDYQMERIGLFGKKVDIRSIDQGRRSALGEILNAYDLYVKDRLFGGSIFSTWLLMDAAGMHGKLETEGKKKVGDRDAWVLKYSPKGGLGSESYIKLYFDAENFHHLRTVYRHKQTEEGFADTQPMNKSTGDADSSFKGVNARGNWGAELASNGSTLTEDFADIREVNGLTLPHQYTIVVDIDGSSGTKEFKYSFAINEYRLQKQFPADFFSFKN